MFTKLIVNAKTAAHCFAKNRDGVTAIEYAIIGVAIATILTTVLGTAGLETAFTTAFSTITAAVSGS